MMLGLRAVFIRRDAKIACGIGDAREIFIDGFESGDLSAWSKVMQ